MKLNSEKKVQDILSSPDSGKPAVVGSTVILGDCVQLMKGYADNHFDLAIVDPPYGIREPAFRRNDANVKRKKQRKQKNTMLLFINKMPRMILTLMNFSELVKTKLSGVVIISGFVVQDAG